MKFIFSDIPLYPGGKRLLYAQWFCWPRSRRYDFKASLDDIIGFYKCEMPRLGWELVDEEKPYESDGGRKVRADLAFRKGKRKVFISIDAFPEANLTRVDFLLVSACPFEIGDIVEFKPPRKLTISEMQGSFESHRIYPGYIGKVTEIKNDMTVYLDDHRGGFPCGAFRLVRKAKEKGKNS